MRGFSNIRSNIREAVGVRGQEGTLKDVRGAHLRSGEGLVERALYNGSTAGQALSVNEINRSSTKRENLWP